MDDGVHGGQRLPWFSGRKNAVLLLYGVNRRLLPQGTLFGNQPDDVLEHFDQALLFSEPVETGQRDRRRVWRLGNREIDFEARYLAGHIGFHSIDEVSTDRYDEAAQSWIDDVDQVDTTARSPFVFLAEDRTLAVLRHRSFGEQALPGVFESLLNMGERRRAAPTTEWDVQTGLDEADFLEWIRSAQSVQQVTFTAKLPNPDARSEFEPVWSRLEERKAKAIREIMEARDPDVGLDGVDRDPIARAFIAMAARRYGWVRGKRRFEGRIETFDQRSKVQKGHLATPLPSDWNELILLIVGFLVERANRRRNEG